MRYVDMPEDERALEFPTSFPVKAMGKPEHNIQSVLETCFETLDIEYDSHSVHSANSRSGKYISVTISMTAQNRQQLDNVYEYLADHPAILMTL